MVISTESHCGRVRGVVGWRWGAGGGIRISVGMLAAPLRPICIKESVSCRETPILVLPLFSHTPSFKAVIALLVTQT